MFLLNRSFSKLASFSFRFLTPGRLFKLLCLIFTSPTTISSTLVGGASGKALARDSRVVTSFFEDRRRFLDAALGFSMRETKAECLIVRLSFFEAMPKAPRSFRLSFLPLVEGLLLGPEVRTWLFAFLIVGACAALASSLTTGRLPCHQGRIYEFLFIVIARLQSLMSRRTARSS